MGDLEDVEVAVVASDDLDADGEAFWREAGRDGDGRVAVIEMNQQERIQSM